LDQWNGSFFCGSAALLRRSLLMQVGGFAGDTITEDAETALGLHALGYNSAYIDRPLISGLQPETFSSFILQRVRWAQGMTQIFLLKNPLRIPGLKLWQRLCYMSSTVFWFFGFARLVFILAPAAYLVFGLHIYDASLGEILAYVAPHMTAAMVAANHLFGKVRWAFVSELYELLQSIFSLPAMVKTLMNPREPDFKVTPKGETVDQNFISSLVRPFYVLYVAVIISVVAGVWRYLELPADRHITTVTLGWALVNFVVLNAALGALYERRQRRSWPRMPADLQAQLFFSGHDAVDCRVNELSVGGALLIVSQKDFDPVSGQKEGEFLAYNDALLRWFRPRVEVRHVKRLEDNLLAVGIKFLYMSQAEVADAVAFAHGDSERWVRFQQSRRIQLGILEGFVLLTRLGTRHAIAHFKAIAATGLESIRNFVLPPAHVRRRQAEAQPGENGKTVAQDVTLEQD
jgi:cellulose synthase (UDP-forming)